MNPAIKIQNYFVMSYIFAYCALCFSCDILRDMPFTVEAWIPGGGYIENIVSVSLLFSHQPDVISVERVFYVTEDGLNIDGKFSWDGRRMYFVPFAPFEKNRDYVVVLEAEACDERGVNMEKNFEGRFTTRLSSERPAVISVQPADETLLSERRQQVRIEFSETVDVNSCVNDISFSPSAGGSWSLEGKTAVFTPKEPWKSGETYKMTISSKLQNSNGGQTGKTFISRFYTSADDTAPSLINASAVDKDGDIVFELAEYDAAAGKYGSMITENTLWENGYSVKLSFSEPVDAAKLKSVLLIEPAPKFTITAPPPYSAEAIISFDENPDWKSRFTVTLGAGIRDAAGNESSETKAFKIFVNGPRSKPPVFAGFTLFKGSAGSPQKIASYTPADLFKTLPISSTDFPYSETVLTYIELYFETASNADIDIFSIMDLFRVEATNTALAFTPLFAASSNFICMDDTEEFSGLSRVEIKGTFVNSANSGIVNFYIAPGLKDSYSNINNESMSIQLLK